MNKLFFRLLFLMTVSFAVTNCATDTSVSGSLINGTIKNANGKLVYLEDVNGNAPIAIDTAIVENNKVQLSAETYKGIYRIRLADVASRNPALIFLKEDSKVKFAFDAEIPNDYTASGNKETEAINKALVEQSEFFKKVETLRGGLSGTTGTEKGDSLNKALQNTYLEAGEKVKASIAEVQDLDPHAGALLLNLLSPQSERQFITEELKKYLEKDPDSKFIKSMGQRYGLVAGGPQPQQQQRPPSGLAIGTKAPEISQASPSGELMTLSSLQGKYVLIDFWASWCKPCRIENPNVVRTYNKYKDKGFEIYSVSFDKQKDRWIKAIQDDGLTWKYHVGDLKGWQNEAAAPYGVRSIPATYLLDPEGNIIAKNLRGPALENKLAEIFGV